MKTIQLSVLALLLLSAAQAQPPAKLEPATIAILDSGIDGTHPELEGRVERHVFVDYASLPIIGSPRPDEAAPDTTGQGTAVASLAAGLTMGLAPEASILDLQVVGRTLPGIIEPETERAAIAALDWVLSESSNRSIDVVLLSFAAAPLTSEGSITMAQQVRALWEAGIVVVIPAVDEYGELHASRYAITATSSDEAGTINVPSAPSTLAKPDITAVGENVTAAAPVPGQGTQTVSGTAYAAARIAGTALVLRHFGVTDPMLNGDYIRDTAQDLGEPGFDNLSGFGLLDANAARQAAEAGDLPPAPERETSPAPAILLVAVGILAAARIRR